MKKLLRTRLFWLTCIMATGILAGCGGKEGSGDVLQVEPVSQSEQFANTGNSSEPESSKEPQDESEDSQKQEPEDSKERIPQTEDSKESSTEGNTDETAELHGDVVSIGEASVVVSKIFIESSAFGEGDVMMVEVGGDNQELINVYFEKDASFTYMTIRNGGKDVETREGSFSDITEGLILEMTGRYEGEDFWANHVDISYVVLSDVW